MSSYMDAGSLNDRVEVLELQETAENTWTWERARLSWADITMDGGRNLFSSIGIGARNAKLTMRQFNLTLHSALRYKGQHLFLTEITRHKTARGYQSITAALVNVTECQKMDDEETVAGSFPAVLTEKYARHSQEWPMSVNDLSLVVVVPKVITLTPGTLLKARGDLWEVCIPHELDEYKNEYEVRRLVDL